MIWMTSLKETQNWRIENKVNWGTKSSSRLFADTKLLQD